eukprot:TRINITY_DN1764_c0_g5_i2.p1 TRINITY_DN1764_c0_g5~~TRINITY_DN1764_c0_g5_i2.p1  ORF type:complete len:1121 (+),score=563.69 TRINITY_DN1764_c0_g5_i2:66-3428(+)
MVKAKKMKSKRVTTKQRAKVTKKVSRHHREARRTARKLKNKGVYAGNKRKEKDPLLQIPNSWGKEKEKMLQEAQNARAQALEERTAMREKAKRRKEWEKKNPEKLRLKRAREQARLADAEAAEKRAVKEAQSLATQYAKILPRCNCVLNVLDARAPLASVSQELERLLVEHQENDLERSEKTVVYVLNKVDLVPRAYTEAWVKHLSAKLYDDDKLKIRRRLAVYSAENTDAPHTLMKLLQTVWMKGVSKKKITAAVVGFPNTGKNSIVRDLEVLSGIVSVHQSNTVPTNLRSKIPGAKELACILFPRDSGVASTACSGFNCLFKRADQTAALDVLTKIADELVAQNWSLVCKHFKIAKVVSGAGLIQAIADKRGLVTPQGKSDLHAAGKAIYGDVCTGRLLVASQQTDADVADFAPLGDATSKHAQKNDLSHPYHQEVMKSVNVMKTKMMSLPPASFVTTDYKAADPPAKKAEDEKYAFEKEHWDGEEEEDEEMEEVEELGEMGSDFGEEGEEMEEMEDDDDDFGVIDGEDSDESRDDDDSSGSDFEAKVAKAKAALQQQQEENERGAMLSQLTKKSNVFSKKKKGAEGEEGDDEEVEEVEEEEEDADEEGGAEEIPFQERKDRIQEILRVLDSIGECREGDHSRQEYLDVLKEDFAEVYEYNTWLMDKLMDLFPPRELFEFLEVNEKQRPMTIRVNTLKTSRRDLAQALTRKGMSVEPTGPWCKVGLQIFESDVAVGSTTEYLAGHYLIQSASSFLPVLAMDIHDNMRVLDMTAAPGGKTTHIAQMMKNSGTLMANDVSAERLVALRGNILRMGITNTIITNYNGVGFERIMNNFDRVLLDAPCTGIGVISRDPAIKTNKSEKDVQLRAMLQKKLILSAIDACKVGGVVVYSTCSILIEENEATVDYALKKRNVKIVDCGVPFGRPGFTKHRRNRFHPSVALSRRYYPHAYNMDGFFVCKIEKLSNGENTNSLWHKEKVEKKEPKGNTLKRKAEPHFPEPPKKVQLRMAGEKDVVPSGKPKAVKLQIKTTDDPKKGKNEEARKKKGKKDTVTKVEERAEAAPLTKRQKKEAAQKEKRLEKKRAANAEYRAKKFASGGAEKKATPTKKATGKKGGKAKKK